MDKANDRYDRPDGVTIAASQCVSEKKTINMRRICVLARFNFIFYLLSGCNKFKKASSMRFEEQFFLKISIDSKIVLFNEISGSRN